MLSWVSLTTPNGYGECALDDVLAIVDNMTQWLRAEGAKPELEEERWVRQILHYILARQDKSLLDINVSHSVEKPVGWTAEDERYWKEWVSLTFPLRQWQHYVLRPVFGSDQRLWEVNIDEWREEIHVFLPMWIRRDIRIVAKLYDRPEPEFSSDEEKPKSRRGQKEIDSYILEQEERRMRGKR